jgi:hypothetical protein
VRDSTTSIEEEFASRMWESEIVQGMVWGEVDAKAAKTVQKGRTLFFCLTSTLSYTQHQGEEGRMGIL